MAQGSVFLIGGGWNEAAFPQTYGPIVRAVTMRGGARIACILLDEDDRDAYFARSAAALTAVGCSDVCPVFVSPERPLRQADVDGVGGILVGGGLTPAYHDAIVPAAATWLPALVEHGMPYAGFSAGAMIAPAQGIIGGWKLRHGENDMVICSEDVSEDLEYLEVRPGLGLVPFAVDVHASQYGTPTRLLHAISAGAVPEGWAIDEDTMIEMTGDTVTIHGVGSAYRAIPDGDALRVEIVAHGECRDLR